MDWRSIQRKNFVRIEDLCEFLTLDADKRARVLASPRFPLNLPYRLAEKIEKNTLDDPILRQFLPLQEELVETPGFMEDPVEDTCVRVEGKLLHKYQGRALLLCSSACAMHCRFCFRQKFPYEKEQKAFDRELDAIKNDPTLKEIILSGGDPLSLSNAFLKDLVTSLSAIPHVSILRFHTRFPIGIPERIDEGFLDILSSTRLQTWFVIHCNHPRELDSDVAGALKAVQKRGVSLLCHTVLLRGVNDTLEVQKALYEKLIDAGVLPYCLNQLDRVQGSAHFEVEKEEGLSLINQLRTCLPGYAVPKYVVEIPGKPSKTVLA